MNNNINTDALKAITSLTIDCQHAQKIGIQLFNHVGEITPDLLQNYDRLQQCCKNIIAYAQELIKTHPNNGDIC